MTTRFLLFETTQAMQVPLKLICSAHARTGSAGRTIPNPNFLTGRRPNLRTADYLIYPTLTVR